jgi:hypothetical protein
MDLIRVETLSPRQRAARTPFKRGVVSKTTPEPVLIGRPEDKSSQRTVCGNLAKEVSAMLRDGPICFPKVLM